MLIADAANTAQLLTVIAIESVFRFLKMINARNEKAMQKNAVFTALLLPERQNSPCFEIRSETSSINLVKKSAANNRSTYPPVNTYITPITVHSEHIGISSRFETGEINDVSPKYFIENGITNSVVQSISERFFIVLYKKLLEGIFTVI